MRWFFPRALVGPACHFVCLSLPGVAAAEAGAVQVAIEPGVANLAATAAQQSAWGFFGGVSVTLEVADLLALEFHVDRKVLLETDPEMTVFVWGPALIYHFDIQPVVPFVAIGIAGLLVTTEDAAPPYAELAPVVSVGINARLPGGFLVGAVFRYYLVPDDLGTADLSSPGYSSINARLGFYFDPG